MIEQKKGVALLLALFTLVIVSLLLAAFLENTTTDLKITDNLLNRSKALYIADAGIEYAISRLRQNPNDFTQKIEFIPGSGNVYEVTYSSKSGTIVSIGRLVTSEEVIIEAKVTISGQGIPYRIKTIYWREL